MPARGGIEPTQEFDFYKENIAAITTLLQFQSYTILYNKRERSIYACCTLFEVKSCFASDIGSEVEIHASPNRDVRWSGIITHMHSRKKKIEASKHRV
jgi:hypothetical protein